MPAQRPAAAAAAAAAGSANSCWLRITAWSEFLVVLLLLLLLVLLLLVRPMVAWQLPIAPVNSSTKARRQIRCNLQPQLG
jgi:hypothetical protein